ncbi:ubiquinone biosynthesis hydroxylase [Xanthobacter dioxanivorans]|uniref:Ubiquinone biosynthesis hydroxylase n=1 Tax=Xanthobacter dioxanivorans TaxID=2528964 RepID=A0A974PRE9_9HYPH|nr:ubiquinone biosynthesis hydroxylase [Xanthobacter dioxanivorans]QRG08354.1 ubiquinone biosynthesis hydroxylase [Xanthobacter dioxanivorans]
MASLNAPHPEFAPGAAATAAAARADVAIVGGGLAGLSLALALRQGLGPDADIVLFDPALAKPTIEDGRASAIAAGARRLLTTLGAWERISREAEPIRSMVVTDSRTKDVARPTFLTFDGGLEDGALEPGEAFAYMVPNAALQHALVDCARAAGIDLRAEAVDAFAADRSGVSLSSASGAPLRAQLLVACDGARSRIRAMAGIANVSWGYGQSGITFTVEHERPHEGRAEEHFLPAGPFATLPLPGNRSSIVWTERTADAERLVALPPVLFQEELEQRFGHRLGWVKPVSKPRPYPLGFAMARTFIGERLALVGDAAHLIHPIAGQGLNMGLRDVAALAEAVTDAARVGLDFAAPSVLERYQRWRRFDTLAMGVATDGLNRLFSNHSDALRAVRDVGLGLVDRLPRLKGLFIRDAAGLTGAVPKLLRGEAL